MEEQIKEYINYKWMLCAIYRENGYIEKNCNSDQEFEYLFFHESNLICLASLLQGSLGYQCFDEYKLNNIASAMEYFISKYENDKDKEKTLRNCTEILKLARHPKGKSIKYFYQEQYDTRYQTSSKKVTNEMKIDIDKQIILDMNNLTYLYQLDVSEKMPINDMQFIKSVNMFIKECPEIVCEENMNLYIGYILQQNKEGKLYKQDDEFKRLNDSLIDYFEQINQNTDEVGKQVLEQMMFSLIFRENLNEVLVELKNDPNKSAFFSQSQFDILCDFIMNNKETCMFDEEMRYNMREILFAFLSENSHLNMKYSLNDLKLNLNILDDKEFKQKNIEFYQKIGKQYRRKMIPQYGEDYIKSFKKMINCFIDGTFYFLLTIIDYNKSYIREAENLYASSYINFIINNYPLIRENPVYMQRIEDLLYANSFWLDMKNEFVLQKENYKVQKKVKKLYK